MAPAGTDPYLKEGKMIWRKVQHLLQALDQRVTENVSLRGARWVHDPEGDPAPRPDEAEAGPPRSAAADHGLPSGSAPGREGKAKIAFV